MDEPFICAGCGGHYAEGPHTVARVGDLAWILCTDCAAFLVRVLRAPRGLAHVIHSFHASAG